MAPLGPHIHCPGTVLSDQYKAATGWEDFLQLVENSEPRIRVLGVTDYLSLRSYERVVAYKAEGRLPDVDLIFPNVEMRFGLQTAKSSHVNVHLLISPRATGSS
nr:AAA domain-containing protein, putative AbiEii toxin, Type IV TA system [Methylobacterium radiotolerans JCM 2831]